MKVEQLMTRNAKTCQPHESLNRAAQLMWEGDIGCIPIVDEANRVVGMVTDRDIAMATYLQGRAPSDISVGAAMSKTVHACRLEEKCSRKPAVPLDAVAFTLAAICQQREAESLIAQ